MIIGVYVFVCSLLVPEPPDRVGVTGDLDVALETVLRQKIKIKSLIQYIHCRRRVVSRAGLGSKQARRAKLGPSCGFAVITTVSRALGASRSNTGREKQNCATTSQLLYCHTVSIKNW